jgi:hypothetical protein
LLARPDGEEDKLIARLLKHFHTLLDILEVGLE